MSIAALNSKYSITGNAVGGQTRGKRFKTPLPKHHLDMYRSATMVKMTAKNDIKYKGTVNGFTSFGCLVPMLYPAKLKYQPKEVYSLKANHDIIEAKKKISSAVTNIKNILSQRYASPI
jgi:hypothetical protein